MKILIKCGACNKDIDVAHEPHIVLSFPKNTPKAWEGYFHFPDCFADFVKVAAQQGVHLTGLRRSAENVSIGDEVDFDATVEPITPRK